MVIVMRSVDWKGKGGESGDEEKLRRDYYGYRRIFMRVLLYLYLVWFLWFLVMDICRKFGNIVRYIGELLLRVYLFFFCMNVYC